MGKFFRLLGVVCVVTGFSTAIVVAQDLVSSDSSGAPLTLNNNTEAFAPAGHHALDVSADGRYVLLSNYPAGGYGLDANSDYGYPVFPDDCQILRKDRKTGELLTVFSSDPDGLKYCNGAKISANGNTVVTSPGGANISCTDGGEVTALIARNLATATDTEVTSVLSPATGDISRICSGPDGTYSYSGEHLHSLNSAGDFAVIGSTAILIGITQPVFKLVDINAGTIEPLALDIPEGTSPWIKGVAINADATQVAVSAVLFSPVLPGYPYPQGPEPTYQPVGPTSPEDLLLCGQIGRCDPVGDLPPANGCGDSWWGWGCSEPGEPAPNAIYILDRIAGTQTVPAALADLPAGTTLLPNAWSADGQRLSFIEIPEFAVGLYFPDDGGPAEYFPADACTAADCELTVHHYEFASATLSSYVTAYDPDTLSLCRPTAGSFYNATDLGCTPRLSRDGNRLLYGRAVTHPFGGDWAPQPSSGNFVCVSRESLEIPGAEPEFFDCSAVVPPYPPFPLPPISGPIVTCSPINPCDNSYSGYIDSGQFNKSPITVYEGTLPDAGETGPCYTFPNCDYFPLIWAIESRYSAPVNWYVLDIPSGHSSLVSVDNAGQLFQSSHTLFSDDGFSVIFRSQDPRLHGDAVTPAAATEAALDEACFWSPAGASSTLRAATNDNTSFFADDEIYVYRETPVFCPVPDPVLDPHIFGVDLTRGVNLAVVSFRSWGRQQGNMQTWIGNFSRSPATLIALNIEISGLGESGNIDIDAAACDIYPPADAATDDSILVRCEFDALARNEVRPLRWSMSGDSNSLITVHTDISGNERELNPRNNSDTDRIMLQNRPWLSWFRGRR